MLYVIKSLTLQKHININIVVDMFENLVSNSYAIWLVIAVILLIVELGTGGFYIICFAIGAIITAILSIFFSTNWQLLIFVLASLVSVFLVRPLFLKLTNKNGVERKSNADAIIGRIGTVSKTIEANGYGRIALDGDDWKACATDDKEIPAGTSVIVVDRDSVIVKVSVLK